jgi:hypothetical protein
MAMTKQAIINGRTYPLWSQFIEQKQKWIGGTLVETGDKMLSRLIGTKPMQTRIIDIVLRENGTDSAWFEIVGKDFSCGSDVHHLSIPSDQDGNPWLTFECCGNRFKIATKGS